MLKEYVLVINIEDEFEVTDGPIVAYGGRLHSWTELFSSNVLLIKLLYLLYWPD